MKQLKSTQKQADEEEEKRRKLVLKQISKMRSNVSDIFGARFSVKKPLMAKGAAAAEYEHDAKQIKHDLTRLMREVKLIE